MEMDKLFTDEERLKAIDMWFVRRMLIIPCSEHVSNDVGTGSKKHSSEGDRWIF